MGAEATRTLLVRNAGVAPLPVVIRPAVKSRPKTFRLASGSCMLGAGSGADVVLEDSTVSREHARLTLVPEGVLVQDLGSRNGVFFMGQRVQRITLARNCQVLLGAAKIGIEIVSDAEDRPALAGETFRGMVGRSEVMRQLFYTIARLDGSLVTVLISGESGVGKELVARAIHEGSQVAAGPFIALNCGALSREMVASALFGHRRGAFTGALEARKGAFAAADGGTLFLDEVGELPLEVQRNTSDAGPSDGSSTDVAVGGDAGPPPTIACPPAFSKEVFRDDFDGSSIDAAKWAVANQDTGGGVFTQLTKMLAANVSVSGGRLRVASKRHCQDPYPTSTPEHPELCSGTNYYSGGWVRAKQGYAAGKGLMIFHAKVPKPVQGTFPALWARNTGSGSTYGELDLIETWWDTKTKGVAGDPNVFFITTWLGSGPINTTGNQAGPFPNLPNVFHVWEAEWDANATPANVKYFYRDAPGATRQLLRTVTVATQGLSGKFTESQYKAILALAWRPYIDFAVEPGTTPWHVGPDAAATYDPEDLEVDSVVVCQP